MNYPRVAWLSAETPDLRGGGGQRRQHFQIDALLRAGVHIRVATLESDQDDTALRDLVPVERYRPRRHGRTDPRFDRLLRTGFDGVVIAHVESLPNVGRAVRRSGLPWALDFQNVNSRFHLARRERGKAVAWMARERWGVRGADMLTTASTEERVALQRVLRGTRTPVAVANNGIAVDEWPETDLGASRTQDVALFASWAHGPNRSGATWLARAVWPLVHKQVPAARLLLLGPGTPPPDVLATPGVHHLGRVESLARELGSVLVAVVPIVEGIGARVKFGEALASGAAVVSTTAGAEGFDAEGVYVRADSPAAFAAACVRLLEDPRAATQLGSMGRALALARFGWPVTSSPLVRWATALPSSRRPSCRT